MRPPLDETGSTFKWSKKATEEMKRINADCNLTAGLQAVVQLAVGARVILRRNIDTSIGLVNGAGEWRAGYRGLN